MTAQKTAVPPATDDDKPAHNRMPSSVGFASLADLMRESPPAEDEYVYEVTAIMEPTGGAVWPAEPAFVKAKTPNAARELLTRTKRIQTKQLCDAAVAALRANGTK